MGTNVPHVNNEINAGMGINSSINQVMAPVMNQGINQGMNSVVNQGMNPVSQPNMYPAYHMGRPQSFQPEPQFPMAPKK